MLGIRGESVRDDTVNSLERELRQHCTIEAIRFCSVYDIRADAVTSSHLAIFAGWRAEREEIGLLRTLRRSDVNKPILVVGANSRVESRNLAFVNGADNYLSPGYLGTELGAKVNRHVARSEFGIEEKPINLQTLRIWPNQAIVMQGNERVPLSRKELTMLLCLAKRSPNPVSREELEREAFGLRHNPGTNVVAVHIHRLRSKFENGSDVLRTVPGKGYQLN